MQLLLFLRYSVFLIGSFIRYPYKQSDRSWYVECLFRLTKKVIIQSETQSISWLRGHDALLNQVLSLSHCGQQTQLAGLPCYFFMPTHQGAKHEQNDENQTVINVYFHGGGFVLKFGRLYHAFCQMLANHSGYQTVLFDYRLAPEHTYPIAHQDCLAQMTTLMTQYPTARFNLIGDSAGSAILLFCYQSVKKTKLEERIARIGLISPWVAPNTPAETLMKFEKTDYLNHHILANWLKSYAPLAQDQKAVEFNLIASFNFEQAAPMFIQFASTEIMAPQIYAFIKAGKQAGATIETDEVADLFHNFQIMAMKSQQGQSAIKKLAAFLQH